MIEYLIGNLIEEAKEGHIQVIAQCCNCMNTMKSGIAPQIASAFPYAYNADQATKRADLSKLGGFSLGEATPEECLLLKYNCPDVYNLYGQYSFTNRQKGVRDLDYNALFSALEAMSADLKDKENLIIGLPALGAGLALGKWRVIEAMILETLCLIGNKVVVYSLNDKAQQELLKNVER